MKLVTICRECAMKPDEVILFALPRYVNIVTQWFKKKGLPECAQWMIFITLLYRKHSVIYSLQKVKFSILFLLFDKIAVIFFILRYRKGAIEMINVYIPNLSNSSGNNKIIQNCYNFCPFLHKTSFMCKK